MQAGGDSGVFETGTDDPSPACGSTPELGPIDIPAWMSQAEGDGLPAAYANMSVVVEGFQVNRDGGGPMSCEYNEVGALLFIHTDTRCLAACSQQITPIRMQPPHHGSQCS